MFLSNFYVEEAIDIAVSKDIVWEYLYNLQMHDLWSPWKVMDPGFRSEVYKQDGKDVYKWKSKSNWDGALRMTKFLVWEYIDFEIVYMGPKWNVVSRSRSFLVLQKTSDTSCRVTWGVHAKLPHGKFFFNTTHSKNYMRRDYLRGLALLKHLWENDGEITVNFSVKWKHDMPEISCVAIQDEVSLASYFSDMEYLKEKFLIELKYLEVQLWENIRVFVYQNMVANAQKVIYWHAVTESLDTLQNRMPESLAAHTLPTGQYFLCQHEGDYWLIQLSWERAYKELERSLHKKHPKRNSYELHQGELIYLCIPID